MCSVVGTRRMTWQFSAGSASSLAAISICFDLSGVRKLQSKRQPLDLGGGGGAFTGEMAQKNRLEKISGKQGGEHSCLNSTQKQEIDKNEF